MKSTNNLQPKEFDDNQPDLGFDDFEKGESFEAGESHSEVDTCPDTDAPLYGDEEDCTDDWKSVDFHAESDGGNTPPTQGPDTASSGEAPESETENQRRTSGEPSTALIKLTSENAEDSEGAETFSSSDFEDPNWISPKYPESLWKSLDGMGQAFCEEWKKDGSAKVTGLNTAFFARLVVLMSNLHQHHGDWYAYSECAGTWHRLDRAELLNVIHRCVMNYGRVSGITEIVKLCSARFCSDVAHFMMPFSGYEDIFDRAPKNVINVQNGTIVIEKDGSIVLHEHSPEFLCRSVINMDYNPAANYSEFVHEVFRDAVSPADQAIIQQYAGQCGLGWNMSQTILIICGNAGTGKSVIVKVIEKVLGRGKYEGLRTNMLDQRFELSRFEGKSLLVASDQYSDALMKKGAHMLKSLTGDDDLTTERKCENDHPIINGEFNVIIVSNSDLPLSIDGDSKAWMRRIRPVNYSGDLPKTIIRRFPNVLLRKYPEQILNWMVDGAAALRGNCDSITPHPEMLRRIDVLIQDSDATYAFVRNCVVRTGNREDVLFSSALFNAFAGSSYFVGSGSKQIIQIKLKKAMKDVHGVNGPSHDVKGSDGKAKYGYVGFRLEEDGPE